MARGAQQPLDRIEATFRVRLQPPPRLRVSDWLDAHRVVSRDYPSPFPGPWRTSRTPYLRQPLDDWTDPSVEYLVMLFSSQIGKTEALFGLLLYSFGVDPGPAMLVMPHLELAASVSTDRLAPALRSCGSLLVGSSTSKARATDNAILHKRINGLPLTLAGANSSASLASRPVRNLFCDEIDKYEQTADGDPLALAVQRTASFRRRKIGLSGTPTVKGASRIEDFYLRSDQQRLFAPCPRCGQFFEVRWYHVRWDAGRPETAHLEHVLYTDTPAGPRPTGGCGGRIEDHERLRMFGAAEWRATAPFSGVRGYRTWAIVSPWLRLSEMVSQFLAKKDKPELLRQFVNEILGESWEPPSERIETASLLQRRERYAAEVPAGAKVLTAGVDVQDGRLEYLIEGWAADSELWKKGGVPVEEGWTIERGTCFGDPAAPAVWQELDEIIRRPRAREGGGQAFVQYTLVDSGFKTADVQAAIIPRQPRRVFPCLGRDGGAQDQLVSWKDVATPHGNARRHVVDVSRAKGIIYSRLRITDPSGPGVLHFHEAVGENFFSELTAEHLVTERNKYGVPSQRWAMRPGLRRNETLDCLGYALAAFRALCPTVSAYLSFVAKIPAASTPGDVGTKQPAPVRARPREPRTRDWEGG